jgi:hypothetical protein
LQRIERRLAELRRMRGDIDETIGELEDMKRDALT